MPSMNEFRALRRNEPSWILLMTKFVPIVYGKTAFVRDAREQLASTFSKPLDKCLALLLLENNYERWNEKAQRELAGETVDPAALPPPHYVDHQHGNGHHRGWTPAGYARYQQLQSLVVDDREGNHAAGVKRRLSNTMISWRRTNLIGELLNVQVAYGI